MSQVMVSPTWRQGEAQDRVPTSPGIDLSVIQVPVDALDLSD
jgi:hypothetical protein